MFYEKPAKKSRKPRRKSQKQEILESLGLVKVVVNGKFPINRRQLCQF